MKRTSTYALRAALVAALAAPPAVTCAQGGEEALAIEELTVTARKREESLQEVPVAISVFNEAAIQAADIKDLEDVSNFTPGFQFVTQGNQQPGRYNTQLKFRGLTTAQFSPSFNTGALFIDGIYVLNGGTSLSLMDIERVEVIKGPQAAYFGRNTFGGAVNLITRDPDMQEFGGRAELRATTRSNNEINAFLEGPIITDRLAFSLGGRYYDKEGHWDATDGGRAGDEQTTAVNAVLKWQATDALSFKLRYGYSEDEDGAPAQSYVSGLMNDSCTGRTIDSPEGPATPTNYICGKVPYGNAVAVDPGLNAISSNTFLPQYAIDEGLTNPDTLPIDVPQLNDIGLRRETERLSLFASYEFGSGYTVDFVYADNEQRANFVRDFDNSDRQSFWSRDPQYMEDESYEIRLSSPQDQRLRWLVGYNSYEQRFLSSGEGGDALTSCFASQQVPLLDNYPEGCIAGTPGAFNLFFPNTLPGADKADVEGFFAAIDFDITDRLTAIFEGRFQDDTITKGRGVVQPDAPIQQQTFDDFLPRAILRWMPTDTTNLYLSYSEGQIAGDFNSTFINANERERQQYLAQNPSTSEVLPAETLVAWEIGWKQGLADGRGQLNLALYHYTWEGIKGRSTALINEDCRPAEMDVDSGCQTANGIEVGDPKQIVDPGTGTVTPLFNSRNVLVPGDPTIIGAEVEFSWLFNEALLLQASYSYIDSEYDDYFFNFVRPIAGFSQMSGNQTPRQSKHSGNLSLTWDTTAFARPFYLRGDAIYNGKAYVDESNLAYVDAWTVVNARAGMDFDAFSVELFVTNLFDEEAWATGARWTDFSSPTQFPFLTAKQGVVVSPLDKREFGLRVHVAF